MSDNRATNPQQKKGIVARQLGDETLLYDPETRKVHVLNKTSLFIWNLCTGQNTVGLIEEQLCTQFDVGQEIARTDVSETLGVFVREGLLAS